MPKDSGALALVVAVVAFLVWRYRNSDQRPVPPGQRPDDATPTAPAGQAATAVAPAAEPELREVDYVLARCGHLDHHPGHVPTASIHRKTAGMDTRDMRKNGWGSNERFTLCYSHNVTGAELRQVHLECDRGCGTRGILDAGDPDVGIGSLRYGGWRNHGDLLVCPYCAGTRSRRWR